MNYLKIVYIFCDLVVIGVVKMDEYIYGLLIFNYFGVE